MPFGCSGRGLRTGPANPTRTGTLGHGRFFKAMDGLPCFDSVTFDGTFPFARLRFEKEGIPLDVELAALNPFIPLDVDASSFPAALLIYRLTNRSVRPVSASVAWSMMNPVGIMDADSKEKDGFSNDPFRDGSVSGVSFSSSRYGSGDLHFGDAALVTDWPDVDLAEALVGGRLVGLGTDLLESVPCSGGRLRNFGKAGDSARVPGSLSCRASLQPGESVEASRSFSPGGFPTPRSIGHHRPSV